MLTTPFSATTGSKKQKRICIKLRKGFLYKIIQNLLQKPYFDKKKFVIVVCLRFAIWMSSIFFVMVLTVIVVEGASLHLIKHCDQLGTSAVFLFFVFFINVAFTAFVLVFSIRNFDAWARESC